MHTIKKKDNTKNYINTRKLETAQLNRQADIYKSRVCLSVCLSVGVLLNHVQTKGSEITDLFLQNQSRSNMVVGTLKRYTNRILQKKTFLHTEAT